MIFENEAVKTLTMKILTMILDETANLPHQQGFGLRATALTYAFGIAVLDDIKTDRRDDMMQEFKKLAESATPLFQELGLIKKETLQ